MTKASDNEFPSILMEEASAPSSPSAGTQRLFVDTADSTLKLKDSSGTVTPVSAAAGARAITIVIDGGGSAITTGIKVDVVVPVDCTVTEAIALLDQTGSIVVDVWNDTYANYPPTNADSITASAPVTVSSAVKSTDSTLTGWTTSLTAGTTLRFNVDSITTAERATIVLLVTPV